EGGVAGAIDLIFADIGARFERAIRLAANSDQARFHRHLIGADAEEAAFRDDDRIDARVAAEYEIRDRTDFAVLAVLERRSEQALARHGVRQFLIDDQRVARLDRR